MRSSGHIRRCRMRAKLKSASKIAVSTTTQDNRLMRNTRRLLLVAFFLAAVLVPITNTAFGKDKVFSSPRAFHAKTYPAHETHDDEKVSIAADPYDMPEKVAGVFTVDYKKDGFLPIFLIVTNDGDGAVSLADMKVTQVTTKRSKVGPAEPDDIYRR